MIKITEVIKVSVEGEREIKEFTAWVKENSIKPLSNAIYYPQFHSVYFQSFFDLEYKERIDKYKESKE